ncbi:MAG: DNA mismatch repair endonuclease MutL, partial [Cyclobacteriaceae bacterium]
MSDIIQLLPDSIANQIAAGEVIQRPASVVKELLENSIDAGSNNITLIVKEAGKVLVQVIDDGAGMSNTDARMCFERHATSKIRAAEDLFRIRTKGFRGEAMASIAAVAQVEMKTRQADEELGTLIQVEASVVKKHEPEACPPGSSICVKNLFFNIPARRNFLKSNPVEMKHIIDEFQRVALAHPDVCFSLFQNDLEVYNLKSGKLSHRIVGLFGKNYQKQLTPCQEETSLMSIEGYLGKPEFAKKTRGEQYFFVNKRFIKSNYLHHAVKTAFVGLIPEDTHPFYVLFIEIDPRHIDVNVHPTKTEIKFDDERTVYGLMKAAVKQSLGFHNITPSLNFDHDTNVELKMDRNELLSNDFSTQKEYQREKQYVSFDNVKSGNQQHWEQLFSGLERDMHEQEDKVVTFSSAANNLSSKNISPGDTKSKLSFQLHNMYIVSQVKSGMLMIDQQAAHERIMYEKYRRSINQSGIASQQLLFPQTIELNPADFELVMELTEEIKSLGFNFEPFGKNSLIIRGIPADLSDSNEKAVFEGLLEQYKFNKSELSL